MKTKIVVNLEIEGLHRWPDANSKIPKVGYLSDSHRHIFKIECKKIVNDNDRQVEFIMFKREILKYLEKKYYDKKYEMSNFGRMSCEDIATELMLKYDLNYCRVMEDGENGAEVEK